MVTIREESCLLQLGSSFLPHSPVARHPLQWQLHGRAQLGSLGPKPQSRAGRCGRDKLCMQTFWSQTQLGFLCDPGQVAYPLCAQMLKTVPGMVKVYRTEGKVKKPDSS